MPSRPRNLSRGSKETKPKMTSYYLSKFRRGAPLVPQCFWAVEPIPDTTPDPAVPVLETSIDAYKKSKRQWRFMGRGRIEGEFVFMTIRAKYLTPFFPVNYQLVFIPVIKTTDGLKPLDSSELLDHGKLYAARWMKDIEQAWQDQRGKQGILFSLHSIISSWEELAVQHPSNDVVVFNRRGRNLSAAMIYHQDSQRYPWNGFIANRNLYWYYPATHDEGHYLCAMLNSDVVNQLAKSHRSQTTSETKALLWNPFEASPIPQFDQEDSQHAYMARLGRECRAILQQGAAKEEIAKNQPSRKRAIQQQMDAINQAAPSILSNRTTDSGSG